jgi:hypothetical protein
MMPKDAFWYLHAFTPAKHAEAIWLKASFNSYVLRKNRPNISEK